MRSKITVTVDNNGNCQIERGNLTPLDAAIILSQVIVQLQVIAAQQGGSTIIATPAGLPGGIRLS